MLDEEEDDRGKNLLSCSADEPRQTEDKGSGTASECCQRAPSSSYKSKLTS